MNEDEEATIAVFEAKLCEQFEQLLVAGPIPYSDKGIELFTKAHDEAEARLTPEQREWMRARIAAMTPAEADAFPGATFVDTSAHDAHIAAGGDPRTAPGFAVRTLLHGPISHSKPEPPPAAVAAALAEANASPCAKSKRGVVAYRALPYPHVVARGHNAQPPGFACDGSDACRAACSKLCVHAEQAVLAQEFFGPRFAAPVYLVHVKTVDGELVPSGGPSCDRCSCLIAADERVHGVWLYHADGWRLYESAEFHALTLQANALPVLRRNP